MQKNANQLIVGAIILAVVAGAVGFLLGRMSRSAVVTRFDSDTEEQEGAKVDVMGTVLTGGNAIAVNDQPAGTNVALALVALSENGWVAIHEDENGKPGRILGAARFDAGQSQTGVVELLRATENGRVYYAMLHRDNGDKQFDHTVDLPVTDSQGNVIMMRFVTSATTTQ